MASSTGPSVGSGKSSLVTSCSRGGGEGEGRGGEGRGEEGLGRARPAEWRRATRRPWQGLVMCCRGMGGGGGGWYALPSAVCAS
jgi:hypothetical protein